MQRVPEQRPRSSAVVPVVGPDLLVPGGVYLPAVSLGLQPFLTKIYTKERCQSGRYEKDSETANRKDFGLYLEEFLFFEESEPLC